MNKFRCLLFTFLAICPLGLLQGQSPDDFNANVSGTVNSLALQPDGKILMGGSFGSVGGVARSRLARLNTDGTPDRSYNPNANNTVYSLAQQVDGKVLAGGNFTTVGGLTRNRIARLNGDGTLDGSFNPDADNRVNSLAVQADGKILMGGSFTTVGGAARNRIARLNEDGTLDISFNPDADNTVYSLAQQANGKILIGGDFTTVGGVVRNRIARLNADGTLDNSFNPDATGVVYSLAVQADGKILMGGSFTNVGGVARDRIARLNEDGTLDSSFNPGANSEVYSMAVQVDGGVLIGGGFTAVAGAARKYLARLNEDGTLDSSFALDADYFVNALALQTDGKILMGGSFTLVGGAARNRMARLSNNIEASLSLFVTDTSQIDWVRGGSAPEVEQVGFERWNGSAWVSLGAGTRVAGGWRKTGLSLPGSGWIRARARTVGGYYTGSSGLVEQFYSYGGGTSPDIAVTVDGGGSLANGSSTLDFGLVNWPSSPPPKTLTITNTGDATLSGLSVSVAGANPGRFAITPLATATLAPGASTSVDVTFSPDGGKISEAAIIIASNDPDETSFTIALAGTGIHQDPGFKPGLIGLGPFLAELPYSVLPQTDGKILVGGNFTTVGGVARNKIARLNADGTLDMSFNPNPNGAVYSLAVQADGKVLMGGGFTTVGGVARKYLARLNSDGTLDSSFNPDLGGGVFSLALQADRRILIGGGFTTVEGAAHNRVARLNDDGTVDISFNADADNSVWSFAQQADGKILIGGDFTTVGGVTRNRIARLNGDGSLDGSFNPDANNRVNSMAERADGTILIGGYFDKVAGVTRNCLARLSEDGTVDSNFNPDTNGAVNSLALQADGKILIGGYFDKVGGVTRKYLARLSEDGTVDSKFNPDASLWVNSVALQADGQILIGGAFSAVGGVARSGIARLPNNIGASSSLVVTGASQIDWMRGGSCPEIGQVGFECWNGTAWVGLGAATRVAGGWSQAGLSLPATGWLRAQGRTHGGVDNGSSGLVEQIISYGGSNFPDIQVTVDGGGRLANGNGTLDFGTLIWPTSSSSRTITITNVGNASLTGLDLSVSGGIPGVFTIDALANTTLAPGASTSVGITFTPGFSSVSATLVIVSNDLDEAPFTIAMVGAGSHQDPGFNPYSNSTVFSLAQQADGKILIGGDFSTVGGVARSGIARLNTDGTVDDSFKPDANSRVNSLAVQADGKILLGGGFTTVGGVGRNRIARLNADGTLDGSFNPNANTAVYSLAQQSDGKILMGGGFTSVGGTTRRGVARLNADGTLDSSFNPNVSGVLSLAPQADGKILIGGHFSIVGVVWRNHVARLNADGTVDNSFNPDANGTVASLALQADGKILMGGDFTTVGGVACNRVARLNSDGTLDNSFNPDANSSVYSLVLQADGRILMGGAFTTVGGTARGRIARLNSDGTLDSSFNPNASDIVYSLALQSDGKILMGGNFNTVGGVARSRFVRLPNNIEAFSSLAVTGTSQIDWERGGSAPEIEQVTFESWDGSSWLSLGAANRVAGGWRKTGLSLPASGWIRAQGRTTGGYNNGSSGLVEQVISYGGGTLPDIVVEDALAGNLVSRGAGLDFGSREIGSTTHRVLTLRNDGTAMLSGLATTVSGTGFSVSAPTLISLAPGESTTCTVSFVPGSAGGFSGSVSIANNDADETPFVIALSGSAYLAPEIALEKPVGTTLLTGSTIGFGTVVSGQTLPGVFTIRNTGAGTLNLGAITVTGTDAADFALTTAGTTPTVASNASTTLLVVFQPATVGAKTATLTIPSNDADENPFILVFTGMGSTGGQETSSPQITLLPGGHVSISFQGIPGGEYQIQRSPDLTPGSWQTIDTITAAPDGQVSFTDENPPVPNGFYRLGKP